MHSTFASASETIVLANSYARNIKTSVFNDTVFKSSLQQLTKLHSLGFNQLNPNIAECFHLESEQREANIKPRMETTLITKVIKSSVKTLAEMNMTFLKPCRHFWNKDMKAEMIGE